MMKTQRIQHIRSGHGGVEVTYQWTGEWRADGESCSFRIIEKCGSLTTAWVGDDDDVAAHDRKAHWKARRRRHQPEDRWLAKVRVIVVGVNLVNAEPIFPVIQHQIEVLLIRRS